tara:strand:- start:264 stop:410 length:147 start_codon:yes stop_codon:yes gene_type:complete
MSRTGDWVIEVMNQAGERFRPMIYWKEILIGLAIAPVLWLLMVLLMAL